MDWRSRHRFLAHRGGQTAEVVKQLAAFCTVAKMLLEARRLFGRGHLIGECRNQLVGMLALFVLHRPPPRTQSLRAVRARASRDRTVPTATPRTSAISS